MATPTKNSADIQYQPLPDDEVYREVYANNVYFEQSAWDLKLIFGQLDQREGKITVRQHTAVTFPWTQIKLFSYWLKGQIEAHEMINGKVRVPTSVIPNELPPPTAEQKKADPNMEKIYDLFNKLRNEFLEDQKT
jgi:hypothetical protein